jgi:hypothetical protein
MFGHMLFARTVGMKEWLCPNCGHLNRSRVNAITGWKVQCRDAHCQRVYIVGEVFYEPVPGFKIPPADHIMPLQISDRKWHSGEPVNRLVRGTDPE